MESIIQSEPRCLLTGSTTNLDRHHLIFGSGQRELSEKYGLWVYLRHDRHIAESRYPTPHNNRELDLELKKMAQAAFEANYPELDFAEIFGRNYK